MAAAVSYDDWRLAAAAAVVDDDERQDKHGVKAI